MYRVSTRSILLTLALVWGACAKPAPPPGTQPAPQPTPQKLSAKVAKVNIFDERRGVDEAGRTLHMPENTIVGQEDEVKPPLTYGERQLMENEAKGYFTPGKRTVEVDIYITKGQQSFKVDEMKETVRVEFALRIEIADQDNIIDVVTAVGESTLSEKAVDVPPVRPAQLYAQAIRESLRRAFDRALSATY